MNHNTATVQIIAEQLRSWRDKRYSTAVLLGAGMSVSAGIPLAKGMIEEIKKQFPRLAATCPRETYAAYMSLLAPAQRRQLIGTFVDNARINSAHLHLGALVKEGYVDRVLTTNFDPLVIRSLALFNIYPAVYDFAASQTFIPGEAAQRSVFYLHGQRDGFVLLNTEEEINRHSEKLGNVFQDVARGRCWIVIGYSGENDPVFDRLGEIDVFQYKLFWVGHKDEEPKAHVLEKILTPLERSERHAYYVKGYDADSFFLALARELDLPEPQIISRPFSHLLEVVNTIAEFRVDDRLADMTSETKRWVAMAIQGFEEGKGFQDLEEARESRIDEAELIRKARNAWVHGSFEEVGELLEALSGSDIPEAREYLAFALNNRGNALLDLARMKEGQDAEVLFRQALAKYAQATRLKAAYPEAFSNWGLALSYLAKTKEDQEGEGLFGQALAKYAQAAELRPDLPEAYYNWGNALSDLAKTKEDQEAEELFRQALAKYAQATQLKPDLPEAHSNWGNALSDLAKTKQGQEAEELFRQALGKYAQATQLKPDVAEAYYNWGNALSDLAKTKEGQEAEGLSRQALAKYAQATELKPDLAEAYYNWGVTLSHLAETKQGQEAEELFRQALAKYARATELRPANPEAHDNWGAALLGLAKTKQGQEAERLWEEALEKCMKAEEFREGAGAYNIACAYSLMGRVEEALDWLEKALATEPRPSRHHVSADKDLANIRDTDKFRKLLGTSPLGALYGKYADADFLTDLEEEHRQEIGDEAAIRS